MNLDGLLRPANNYEKPERCSKCGGETEYSGLGEYKCKKCGNIDYDSYGKVRVFLENNPGANIVRTEAATGVPKHLIEQMVREGRFSATGYMGEPKGE